MNAGASDAAAKAVDAIQERLADYACTLTYDRLPSNVVHAAKARVIDTLGVVVGGVFGEASRIARDIAAQTPDPRGATVIGTRIRTTPDLAAFANGVTARHVDMLDVYHRKGSYHGHGSDTLMPIFAAAEHARVNGRDFITAVVLGYEIMCRMCDAFPNRDFDNTNFACLATAMASAKLMGLTRAQMAHCISMTVVPNVILRQVRMGQSVWKIVASGHAGRAGVFAAMLARAGMKGPHLPFEGKAGWCAHVARKPIKLEALGGGSEPFRILETLIKHRPSMGETISSILAAEKVATQCSLSAVERITVEVYAKAWEAAGNGEQRWDPKTHESADHSIPYVVAATLLDGTVTPRSFNDAHLNDQRLRALMCKIEVVKTDEFTRAYEGPAHEHRSRVTVHSANGERWSAESGGDNDDLSWPKTDAQIEKKFRMLTEDLMPARHVDAVLARLWCLEDMPDVAAIVNDFVL